MIWHSGSALRDRLDPVERLDAEPAVVLVAGADGEGQRIDQQVATPAARSRPQAKSCSRRAIASFWAASFAMPCSSMVSAITAAPKRRASSSRLPALSSPSSKLIGVDDRLCRHRASSAALEHRQLGRIDDERRRDGAAQPLHRLAHVGGSRRARRRRCRGRSRASPRCTCSRAISTHAVPLALLLQLAEALRAVGVAALADREIGVLLAQRHLRRRARRAPAPTRCAAPSCAGGTRRARSAAACASSAAMWREVEPQQPPMRSTPNSPTNRSCHCASSSRRERVMRVAVDQLGQAGIGLARQQPRPVLGEPAHMLGHLAADRWRS